MKSKTTLRFRKAFALLPHKIREQARNNYRLFRQNNRHPGLRFKQIHSNMPIYSVRIGRDYRAIGYKTENEIVWFWIGSHSDYENLIENL